MDYLVDVESESRAGKVKEAVTYGKTGIELLYSTKNISEDAVDQVKAEALYKLSESKMRDTIRGFSMNFIAHKGMFPFSDILFGVVGAYEGMKSDMGRSEIDFEQRYKNLVDMHISLNESLDSDEVSYSEIEKELED